MIFDPFLGRLATSSDKAAAGVFWPREMNMSWLPLLGTIRVNSVPESATAKPL
jgi:hypothetical protein